MKVLVQVPDDELTTYVKPIYHNVLALDFVKSDKEYVLHATYFDGQNLRCLWGDEIKIIDKTLPEDWVNEEKSTIFPYSHLGVRNFAHENLIIENAFDDCEYAINKIKKYTLNEKDESLFKFKALNLDNDFYINGIENYVNKKNKENFGNNLFHENTKIIIDALLSIKKGKTISDEIIDGFYRALTINDEQAVALFLNFSEIRWLINKPIPCDPSKRRPLEIAIESISVEMLVLMRFYGALVLDRFIELTYDDELKKLLRIDNEEFYKRLLASTW